MYSYPVKLSRILANLVMNSIDTLEAAKRENPLIKITAKQINKKIEIKVVDNGTGIKNEDKENIFKMSFTTKKDKNHAGLGLNISKEILKKYFSGNISFKSKYGTGTEFLIEFPIKTNEIDNRKRSKVYL